MEAPILDRIARQHEALLRALRRAERLSEGAPGNALETALMDLDRRLRAHAAVNEELILCRLRDCAGPWQALVVELEAEHETLRCATSQLLAAACSSGGLSPFASLVRRHLEREAELLSGIGALPRERLAELPAWIADELYERSGGPVDRWPEKWLG